MAFIDRLERVYDSKKAFRERLNQKEKPSTYDKGGSATIGIEVELRFYGIAEYQMNSDVAAFKSQLSESVRMTISLYERHNAGEDIIDEYVGMYRYSAMFTALAAGDFDNTLTLAQIIGNREAIESKHDTPVGLGR